MAEEAKERVSTATLAYAVRRRDTELVGPAVPTPRETKRLSDIDDQDILRCHVTMALFYRGGARLEDGVDPVSVIRRALGEALGHYYPLAGRLREVEGRKLVVDCTGEGVLFVEADADVRLAELEAVGLRPPFPGWDQLLFDVEGSSSLLNTPLLFIQVTRLLCGGLVFALRLNHTICDGIGLIQFLNSVTKLSRGLPSTTVTPTWSRELLEARNPPTSAHGEFDFDLLPPPPPTAGNMVVRSFTFGASHLAAIKRSLPLLLGDTATTFEALAAFVWRARTAALEVPPGEDAPLGFAVNFRGDPKMGLPAGYYGNACVPATVVANAAALINGSLGDAVALVRLARAAVTADYVRSFIDELLLRGRRWFIPANIFLLSDVRLAGFNCLDFGWGKPVFGGPADAVTFFIAIKDRDGEDAVVMPIVLPGPAMDRFAAEVERLCMSVSKL